MRHFIAILAFSLGMIACARSANYPIYNGSWWVVRTEFNGTTRTFPTEAGACKSGPWMDFEGDKRIWLGITTLASHRLRSMARRGDNGYFLDEGANPFDARVLEIIELDHVKLTLVDGAVIWLVYCYSGR